VFYIFASPGASIVKPFTAVIYRFSLKAKEIVSGKPFQPSLMLVSKVGTYPSEAPFRCSTLGRLLVSPANIRLSWKGLLRKSVNYAHKKFYSTGTLDIKIPTSS
jgi:hypothetical protein